MSVAEAPAFVLTTVCTSTLQATHAEHTEEQYNSFTDLPQHTEDGRMALQAMAEHQEVPQRIQAWPALQPRLGQQQQQPDEVPSAVQQRAAQYAGDEGLARPPTRPPSDWRPRTSSAEPDPAVTSASLQADHDVAR